MSDSNVLLVARFKAKSGKEEEVQNILESVVEPTRAEEGCLFYHLHRVKEDEGHFLFYECFRDEEAFQFHVETPYIKGFLDRQDELLAEPPDIHFLEKMH
jgi:quinol monooxygenase YgiN